MKELYMNTRGAPQTVSGQRQWDATNTSMRGQDPSRPDVRTPGKYYNNTVKPRTFNINPQSKNLF